MRCTAKNRQGEQCGNHATAGTSKCKFHGGASLVGVASPTFKTGRYSRDIPTRLAARYGDALADPHLLELRDEIGLVGTRLAELLTQLDSGESAQRWKEAQSAYSDLQIAIATKDTAAFGIAMKAMGDTLQAGSGDQLIWRDIVELVDTRRKLAESERKRLIELQQTISVEKAMALLAMITDTIRKHVHDTTALAAISADLRQFTVIDAG